MHVLYYALTKTYEYSQIALPLQQILNIHLILSESNNKLPNITSYV